MKKRKPDQRLKVIWMHSHFLYWMGGTKYVFEVVKQLKDRFDITVVVENASDLARDNYEKIGVELLSMERPTSTSALYWIGLQGNLDADTALVQRLVDTYVSQGREVLVYTNMFPMNVVANRLGLPHVQYIFEPFAFFHDPEFIAKFPVMKRWFVKTLKRLHAKKDIEATKRANVILTLNNTIARYIQELYGKEAVVCYTGIDTDHFKPYVSKELKDRYAGKDLLIHSTDYSPVKGTDRMLRIFAKVKKTLPDAHLLITSTIKDPAMERALKELCVELGISEDVEFLGFVDYDVLPQLYSLARVLVQCSFSEKSGTTSMALPVKEALACETWAIRYPIEGEDVIDGECGHLVDPRDEALMVERIVEVFEMKDSEYKSGAKKARKWIVETYRWENTGKIIGDEIERVMKQ